MHREGEKSGSKKAALSVQMDGLIKLEAQTSYPQEQGSKERVAPNAGRQVKVDMVICRSSSQVALFLSLKHKAR